MNGDLSVSFHHFLSSEKMDQHKNNLPVQTQWRGSGYEKPQAEKLLTAVSGCTGFSLTFNKNSASIWTRLTWQHSENGGEGVELEAVDDIAKVTDFQRHEEASCGQQEDVQTFSHDAQPEHACGERSALATTRPEEHKGDEEEEDSPTFSSYRLQLTFSAK